MSIQKTLAAGVVALTALAATAPVQAGSISVGIYGENGGATFRSGDGYQPVDYRHGNRHWRGRRYERRDDWRYERRDDWRHDGDWDYAHLRMSPYQVRRSLRHRGFYDVRFIDAYGQIYKAIAIGPRGGRFLLTIRSRDAAILEAQRMRHHYYY